MYLFLSQKNVSRTFFPYCSAQKLFLCQSDCAFSLHEWSIKLRLAVRAILSPFEKWVFLHNAYACVNCTCFPLLSCSKFNDTHLLEHAIIYIYMCVCVSKFNETHLLEHAIYICMCVCVCVCVCFKIQWHTSVRACYIYIYMYVCVCMFQNSMKHIC